MHLGAAGFGFLGCWNAAWKKGWLKCRASRAFENRHRCCSCCTSYAPAHHTVCDEPSRFLTDKSTSTTPPPSLRSNSQLCLALGSGERCATWSSWACSRSAWNGLYSDGCCCARCHAQTKGWTGLHCARIFLCCWRSVLILLFSGHFKTEQTAGRWED